MKFIGQFIQSLVARFRNDVYLEDISTGTIASGGNLGLDANNKIVKADTNAGELSITNATDNLVVTSTGGTGLNAESGLQFTTFLRINDTVGDVKIGAGNIPFSYNPDVINSPYGQITFESAALSGTGLGALIEQSDLSSGNHTGAPLGIKAGGSVGTDKSGGNLELAGGRGTGSGAGGSLRFWSAPAGTSGDSYNTSAVKFSVDSGGNATISGGLTMGSTSFVNSSGVVQVATQGTIDHDSLANFVAAEHYRWDTDISSTATIHTNNITDLHGAGVSGSADQLLTDDGDGTVTSESEAKIQTVAGLSKFLKNTSHSTFLNTASSSSSFNLYEDIVYHHPSSGDKTCRGMIVSLNKGFTTAYTSGTLTQIGGSFSCNDALGSNTGATVNSTALVASVVGNTSGTTSGTGIDVDVTGTDVSNGIIITTKDGSDSTGHDIKITSSVDTADFFSIRTFGSGETEITTVDSDGANAADLSVDIDGDITLDSVTGNIIGKANGSTYTPSADNHLATKKYVDDNIPDEVVDNGQTFIWKHVHVTADATDCNNMHTTPKELIAAQGSGTIIVLGPGYLFVDKNTAIAQAESAADLNFHFADLEPGVFGQTSLMHIRRFMNADNADRIFMLNGNEREVGQSLTQGTNKAIEASFDSAITSGSMTKIEFYLSYYVITL